MVTEKILSDFQWKTKKHKELAALHIKAYGSVVIWRVKGSGKVRILPADEVFVVRK